MTERLHLHDEQAADLAKISRIPRQKRAAGKESRCRDEAIGKGQPGRSANRRGDARNLRIDRDYGNGMNDLIQQAFVRGSEFAETEQFRLGNCGKIKGNFLLQCLANDGNRDCISREVVDDRVGIESEQERLFARPRPRSTHRLQLPDHRGRATFPGPGGVLPPGTPLLPSRRKRARPGNRFDECLSHGQIVPHRGSFRQIPLHF